MGAYLQQGHGSWGLLEEVDIGSYEGVVLSPVNDGPEAVRNGLLRLKDLRDKLEVILDPQLYNPAVDKGKLAEWNYYPDDFATGDHSAASWWTARGRAVVDEANQLGIDAICSPAMFPRDFSNEYYRLVVEVADETFDYAAEQGIETLVTAIICLKDLANQNRALEIASILSSSKCNRIYLTFLDELPPREPLKDGAALPTAVHLIRLLSQDLRVHVAFCAHDLVMWKFAGAADVSSGKFFNLRRFSLGRWKEEETGGRQVTYWNEDRLGVWLRDQDVLRLNREGWYDGHDLRKNPAGARILDILRGGKGEPWQKHSWLQYLRWVHDTDAIFSQPGEAEKALELWAENWRALNAKRVQFTDWFNDGSHVRLWLGAVREGAAR